MRPSHLGMGSFGVTSCSLLSSLTDSSPFPSFQRLVAWSKASEGDMVCGVALGGKSMMKRSRRRRDRNDGMIGILLGIDEG